MDCCNVDRQLTIITKLTTHWGKQEREDHIETWKLSQCKQCWHTFIMLRRLTTKCDNVDNWQLIVEMSSKLTTNQPKRFHLDIRPRPEAQHTEQHQLGHLCTNILSLTCRNNFTIICHIILKWAETRLSIDREFVCIFDVICAWHPWLSLSLLLITIIITSTCIWHT